MPGTRFDGVAGTVFHASTLLPPDLAWASFAAVHNGTIWRLNP
ncbi:MAG: hypothetical protein ABL974_23805 [Prosthecobacter sp.]